LAIGFDVRTALDGESALAAIESAEPDAVVLDVMMPGMDGFEVARHIRQNQKLYIPILLASALDPYELWPRGVAAGVDDVLQKPANLHELRTRVRNMYKLRCWHRALTRHDEGRPHRAALAAKLRQGETLTAEEHAMLLGLLDDHELGAQ
jgi:DNA-binding response OmpR family regulator